MMYPHNYWHRDRRDSVLRRTSYPRSLRKYWGLWKTAHGFRKPRRYKRNLDPSLLIALNRRRNLDPERLISFRRHNLDPERLMSFRRNLDTDLDLERLATLRRYNPYSNRDRYPRRHRKSYYNRFRQPYGWRHNPDPKGQPWGPALYNPLLDNRHKFKNESHYVRMISKLRRNPWR